MNIRRFFSVRSQALSVSLLALVCVPLQATTLVSNASVSVIKIGVLPEYQSGVVLVTASKTVEGCETGYWINAEAPGGDRALSVLLSAKHTGALLSITADKDRLWTGSSGKYCHIHLLWQL